ncbi:MAG: aminodeoxychorismate/anthranilate synthase component II [Alteromonadaceae bacterium]|nr:aminodeoxychorismate/anthranilate synthase component II [Alteromonadaceae bacterium]
MASSINTANTQLFMLDNLDSFTYNLVDEFQLSGHQPIIYRNTISAEFIFEKIQHSVAQGKQVLLVLSPGPGEPSKAGCLMALIEKCAGIFPMLGICLGHQALIEHYGGTIVRANEIVHGKSSNITHCGSGAFANITNPLPVARYHSLVGTNIPSELTVTASFTPENSAAADNSMVMAIEHSQDAVIGMQFHPESILTTYGSTLLAQSIKHLLAQPLANTNTPETGA